MKTEGQKIFEKILETDKHNGKESQHTTVQDILGRGRPEWDKADEAFYEYKRFAAASELIQGTLLQFLNMSGLRNATDKSIRALSFTIAAQNLRELSIWGCTQITNKGFLDLCMCKKNQNFSHLNFAQCPKISGDARTWTKASFKQTINIYSEVEDFGCDRIDLSQFVEVTDPIIEDEDKLHPSQEFIAEVLADKTLDRSAELRKQRSRMNSSNRSIGSIDMDMDSIDEADENEGSSTTNKSSSKENNLSSSMTFDNIQMPRVLPQKSTKTDISSENNFAL
jgi:hypothetical protein